MFERILVSCDNKKDHDKVVELVVEFVDGMEGSCQFCSCN